MDLLNLPSAFQSVKANNGCAGVDGVTIKQFESRLEQNLATLRTEIEQDRY